MRKMTYSWEFNDEVAIYVTKLFLHFQTPDLVYHNLIHTQKVVARANEIAANYSSDAPDLFIINTAAWFHDIGHLFGTVEGHEERSNLIMRDYLENKGISEKDIEVIEQCILATRFPYKPNSFSDEIICDADSYHLGTDEFLLTDELVKKEMIQRKNFSPENWNEITLAILEKHNFFTGYCRYLLGNGKQRNIDLVRAKINGSR